MDFQPLTILLTLVGGLLLAGILGWIKRSRLVVFVPRLFSHSRLSDKGQIAEISVMNRGFKTEESVELSLSPSLHYELIGSNNPDASLLANKLLIPRIGSSDDCSVLLQVENGKFTHEEIVNCLSKETKAVVATKLEDVPVTAQQRIGILLFFGFIALLALLMLKGVDYITAKTSNVPTTAVSENKNAMEVDTQGWNIGKVYANERNVLFQALVKKQIEISTGTPIVQKNTAVIQISVKNSSPMPIKMRLGLTGSAPQDPLPITKRRVFEKLLFPNDSTNETLEAILPADMTRRKVIVDFFIESTSGETMSGQRIIDAGKS